MPEAARLGDTITHTNKLGGFLAGALLGAAVGAFVVATGGAGALVIAGAVATGASLGSQVGKLFGGMMKVPKGRIITGAVKVFINGRPAARACIDTALCDDHTIKKIAMGSVTVGIESGAAARIGDKGECGFEVGEGSSNVVIGGDQGMCPGLSVADEVPAWMETASFVLGLAGAAGLMRAAGWGALRIGASLVGGEVGSRVGGHYGQQWGGTWGGAFGSLLGALAGGGAGSWAGRRATPFVNRLEVRTVGLGSNLGNVRVGLRPATVQKVGGRYPINSKYAGQKYPAENLPPDVRAKYPDSVRFDEKGFPDFGPYAEKSVDIPYSGDRATDFRLANEAAGLRRTPEGMTWHHHQNGKTMQLVPTDLHDAVRHTGGVATSGLPYK